MTDTAKTSACRSNAVQAGSCWQMYGGGDTDWPSCTQGDIEKHRKCSRGVQQTRFHHYSKKKVFLIDSRMVPAVKDFIQTVKVQNCLTFCSVAKNINKKLQFCQICPVIAEHLEPHCSSSAPDWLHCLRDKKRMAANCLSCF